MSLSDAVATYISSRGMPLVGQETDPQLLAFVAAQQNPPSDDWVTQQLQLQQAADWLRNNPPEAPVFDDVFAEGVFSAFGDDSALPSFSDDFAGLGDVVGGIQQGVGTISQVVGTARQIDTLFSGGGGGVGGARSVIPTGGSVIPTGGLMNDSGDMVPTAGSIGGALAAGGMWLGSYLARAFGRNAAGAVFTAANGIRVRLAQLWPLVRQYGPTAVAGALGITAGALSTLLEQAPRTGSYGRRRRRRGISANDVSTTKRTLKQIRKLCGLAGIRRGGGGGRYYRPRGRSGHYHYFR